MFALYEALSLANTKNKELLDSEAEILSNLIKNEALQGNYTLVIDNKYHPITMSTLRHCGYEIINTYDGDNKAAYLIKWDKI